jgi:hypothetical protein
MLGSENVKFEWNTKNHHKTIGPEVGWRQYKHHVFDKNDNVDVFLHTRDPDHLDAILELYKPKRYLAEPYSDFDVEEFCKGHMPIAHQRKCANAMWSKFYSIHKSVAQKAEYEKENNFKYDCVFLSRYDYLAFEDIIFSDYDMEYFYVSACIWQFKNRVGSLAEGFPDLWFFSDSEKMDRFSELYLNLEPHCRDHLNNHVSQHLATRHKLKELDYKVRFILNADACSTTDTIDRCALARSRKQKFWNYDKETKLYSVKPEFKEGLNTEILDYNWEKRFQDQWAMYEGLSEQEWGSRRNDEKEKED